MRDEDPQADNLFSRLISYTPRCADGGGSRTALEDYYTEALAWCLRNSDGFRKRFLEIIDKHSTPKTDLKLADKGDLVTIDTQLSFDAESDEENGEVPSLRRFDLVIHSDNSDGFVVVLEDKIKWAFTANQLPAYLKELKIGRFKEYRKKVLAVLSPFGRKPQITEETIPLVSISWGEVQEALAEVSNPAEQKLEHEICGQFARFLESKGLSPMKIDKLNPDELKSSKVFLTFYSASLKLLEQFRETQNEIWKPKRIEHEDKNGELFCWGVFSKRGKEDWCGFCFFYTKERPEVTMHIEGVFKKGIGWNGIRPLLGETLQEAFLEKRCNLEEAAIGTYVSFYERVNSRYDGNPAAIIEWLSSAAKEFKNLRNRAGLDF